MTNQKQRHESPEQNQQAKHPSIKFFKALYQHCIHPASCIELRPISIDGVTRQQWVPLNDLQSIPGWLDYFRKEKPFQRGVDFYFGVATRTEGQGDTDGLIEIPAVFCDIDLAEMKDDEKKEVFKKLAEFPIKPFFVINSGGGLHVYWKLKEPATRKDIPKVESVQRGLFAFFCPQLKTHSVDVAHILRVPGTLNMKKKYKTPRPVTIEASNTGCECLLSDFNFLPLPKVAPSLKNGKNQLPKDWYKEVLNVNEDRNVSMTRLAGRYYGKGLSQEEVRPLLHSINKENYKPPMENSEVERILDHVWKTHQRKHPEEPPPVDEPRPPLTVVPPSTKQKRKVEYHATTIEDVLKYENPEFLIEGILFKGTLNVLSGYTGEGKSMVALSIAKAILTGENLWGRFPVKKGSVLLIDEETPRPWLKDRIKRFNFTPDLPYSFLHFQTVKVDSDEHFNALCEEIERLKPTLIVIDSLIRVHGQDEQSSSDMQRVSDRLRKIANNGSTILTIHHHKKGGDNLSQKSRGSTEIIAGIDIEYALTKKNPDDKFLIFQSVKTRTEKIPPIRLKLEVTPDKMEVTYAGTEAEETLKLAIDVLRSYPSTRMNFQEIYQELETRGHEVGEKSLRKALKEGVDQRIIQTEKEKVGKTRKFVWWVEVINIKSGDI